MFDINDLCHFSFYSELVNSFCIAECVNCVGFDGKADSMRYNRAVCMAKCIGALTATRQALCYS